MEHGPYCNCEECWWARGGERCPTCGCVVGHGCPHSEVEEEQDDARL